MTNEEMLALAREKLNPVVRGEHCETGFVSALIEGKTAGFTRASTSISPAGWAFAPSGRRPRR